MATQLSDVGIVVNNEPINIIPNSVKYKDGKGEQKYTALSGGGGSVTGLFSNDVSTNIGSVTFSIPVTVETADLVRIWKDRRSNNLVQVWGSTPEGTLTRSFRQAALVNDYEVNPSSEGVIEIEFKSLPAV